MKKWGRGLFFTGMALFFLGCGHTAYLGMHGRSIRLYPDIHTSAVEDSQCLECHHPDNPEGPACPHPDFKGCIKCHNDEV
jgi:hypothetical protein